MGLDWHVVKETRRGKYWEAEYEAYPTPDGPAVATARIEPDVYFPGHFKCTTWVEDPYLASVGACYYATISESSGDEEYCFAVCEEFGVQEATGCLRTFPIARMYENAVLKLARRWLEERGIVVEEIIPVDRRTVQARVLEGGYEPARVELRLGDDLGFDMWYK